MNAMPHRQKRRMLGRAPLQVEPPGCDLAHVGVNALRRLGDDRVERPRRPIGDEDACHHAIAGRGPGQAGDEPARQRAETLERRRGRIVAMA